MKVDMSSMNPMKKLHRSETGIASLIITIVMMVIISLIVVGFAQISRREQKGSLDRQLSTQAFYAAESGVNDVKALIASLPPSSIVPKTTCADTATAPAPEKAAYGGTKLTYTLSGDNSVGYTCILVSPYVSQLVKQQAADSDWVVPIVPSDSTGAASSANDLTVSWTPQTGSGPAAGCAVSNPTVAARSNCNYSLLRFELVPITDVSRDGLRGNDMVSYFYPVAGCGGASCGTVSYAPTGNNSGVKQTKAQCNPGSCTMTITGLPASPGGYYARIHAMYVGTTVTITGTNASGAVKFAGAQVQIDSTGKAQDVLRRIRVSYALTGSKDGSYAQDAIESRDSICKRFAVAPNQPLSAGTLETGNPYCGDYPVPIPGT
jgi:Tfp pilus assembly protein PilX